MAGQSTFRTGSRTATENRPVDDAPGARFRPGVRARSVRRRRSALAQYRRVRYGLAATDALCIVVALLVLLAAGVAGDSWSSAFLGVVLVAPAAWIVVFAFYELYAVHNLSAWEEFRRIINASTAGTVLVVLASFWWSPPSLRSALGATWLTGLSLELVSRRAWRWHLHRRRLGGALTLRTLVVGDDDAGGRLSSMFESSQVGLSPVGFVSTSGSRATRHGRLPAVGDVEDLRSIIRAQEAECLVVSSRDSSDVAEVLRVARQEDVLVKVAANVPELLTSRVLVQPVGRVLTLSLKPVRLTRTQAALKRGFDVAVASFGLVVASPLMLVIAVAVRLTSPGPVLFRQERVTKGGRTFSICKFRTMVRDADRADGHVVELTRPFFKEVDDPRLTRIGRALRRFSLDELPQLWNVVRGDMSLVGPRPLPAVQVAANERLGPRHEVLAGLTGWWQVNGRSGVGPDEALEMDLFYIENWSLALDVYIVLKTVRTVLSGRGAC